MRGVESCAQPSWKRTTGRRAPPRCSSGTPPTTVLAHTPDSHAPSIHMAALRVALERPSGARCPSPCPRCLLPTWRDSPPFLYTQHRHFRSLHGIDSEMRDRCVERHCTILLCVCLPCPHGDTPHTSTRSSFGALASQSSSLRPAARPESCWNAWSSNGMWLKHQPPSLCAFATLLFEHGCDWHAPLKSLYDGALTLCVQVHPSPGA